MGRSLQAQEDIKINISLEQIMLRIIKTNINLMNKVSLISLNLNEIFMEENEVSSLPRVTQCRCWLPRAASSGSVWIRRMKKEAGLTSGLTRHEQGSDCSDLV